MIGTSCHARTVSPTIIAGTWVAFFPRVPAIIVHDPDRYPFCNPKLSMDERVDDLITRLTLDEKPYL